MEAITCPYCGNQNHTSIPEAMSECAYCNIPFAEIRTPYQRLTVLDGRLHDAWDLADELAAKWEERGELDREVIVDRRLREEPHTGPERRRIAGAALPVPAMRH